uniref:Zinc finger protein 174 n=1 Tax=Sus scrofa TaxID=9823 RepID=A0A8D1A3B9_PIG
MAAKMEITLNSQCHIQASSKQERHIIGKLEEKREPAQQKDWPDPELSRQNFRRFCYQEASGPQEALSRLRQLCRQWLQPEVHTKEQILELLVVEQFLNILPPEIQARARRRCPVSSKEIVTLVEDFHRAAKGPKQWVAVCMEGQKVLLEKTGSQLGEQELPDFQPQTPRRHPRESPLEETSQEGSQDQRSPHPREKSPLLQEPAPKLAGTAALPLGASFQFHSPPYTPVSGNKTAPNMCQWDTVPAAPTEGRSRRAGRLDFLIFSKDHHIPELARTKPNWRPSFYTIPSTSERLAEEKPTEYLFDLRPLSSLVARWVEGPALSAQQLRSLLWCLGTSTC